MTIHWIKWRLRGEGPKIFEIFIWEKGNFKKIVRNLGFIMFGLFHHWKASAWFWILRTDIKRSAWPACAHLYSEIYLIVHCFSEYRLSPNFLIFWGYEHASECLIFLVLISDKKYSVLKQESFIRKNYIANQRIEKH